jgi:L-asparaginase/Glu-tRNA(Gln) amidotransferase subunit D
MNSTYEQYEQDMLKNGSKIAMIVTGGLIIEDGIKRTNSEELLDLIKPEINSKIIDLIEFSVVDSSTIDLDFLHSLAKLVQRKINSQNITGIVILHGTCFLYK